MKDITITNKPTMLTIKEAAKLVQGDLYERYYNYKQTNNADNKGSRQACAGFDRIQSQGAVQIGRAALLQGREEVSDQ